MLFLYEVSIVRQYFFGRKLCLLYDIMVHLWLFRIKIKIEYQCYYSPLHLSFLRPSVRHSVLLLILTYYGILHFFGVETKNWEIFKFSNKRTYARTWPPNTHVDSMPENANMENNFWKGWEWFRTGCQINKYLQLIFSIKKSKVNSKKF